MYLWQGISFFDLQTAMVENLVKWLEESTVTKTVEFKTKQLQTEKMYVYLSEFEKPVDMKIAEVKKKNRAIVLLKSERELITKFGN